MILGELMSTQNIHISHKTIGKLLKEGKLKVPPSQRPYRWGVEHVEELFRDIRAAMGEGAEEYFLGSIVSIESEGSTLIYDGQQRLATVTILIAAIRNNLIELNNEKDGKIIERDYLLSERRGGVGSDPHLILNLEDAEFFATRVLPISPATKERRGQLKIRDSNKKLESAAKAAKEFVEILVKRRTPEDASAELNRWVDYIELALQVISVQVVDEGTAFTIFETMNDRGLKLSAADLLKNFLHAKADNRRDEVIQKWASMTGVLETVEGEEDNVVEYIRCFWVSRYGHTRTRYLYDQIKGKTVNKTKAITLVSELENTVQDYAAIIMASHERAASRGEVVKSAVETIHILGVTQLRPMLLSAFTKFGHGEFSKLIAQSVSWSVRFLVNGTPSGTIESYYARIAADIWDGKIKTAVEAVSVVRPILPKDDEFRSSFADATQSKAKIARYYLKELQLQSDGSTVSDSLTLEHLVDKKYDNARHPLSQEEHKTSLHRIGNLVLIDEATNGSMQGMTFAQKKSILACAANPSLTQDVSTCAKWDTSEIDARQKKLAELAVKTWPI